MTPEEYDQYVEDCIKSEIETFYPEEFERLYGEKSRYYYPKMKIYTYYENINFKQQDELVEFWKKSWADNNFDPIVLTLDDAKKSTYYEEFVHQLRVLSQEATGHPLSKYGLSCYLRWLAYSTQEETESFLVSDYDIINKQFTPVKLNEPKDRLCFMSGACPCLAYGTSKQYLSFCEDIVSYTTKNMEHVKLNLIKKEWKNYHDQEFLSISQTTFRDKTSLYNICRPREYVMPAHLIEELSKTKECNVIHFSHYSSNCIKKENPEFKNISLSELRIKLIKELLAI